MITYYKKFLKEKDSLRNEVFVYENLSINDLEVSYNNVKAKKVVFAEGFGIKNNPFFKDIPLNGTKGEVLTIKAPDLKIDFAIKSSVFIIPLGQDNYVVGSTYNWTDKSNNPTEEAKEELTSKLKAFIKCDFEVVDHVAGIRPTVKDRRPLIGAHKDHQNIYVLNGLGTRGVMIAPYVANELYDFIENNAELDKEIDFRRFTS